MTDLIRWHTEPEETPFTGYSSSTGRRQKELSELINSNSTRPLYWEIQDKLSSPTNLDREDREWLQSIRDAFDSYVIKILNGLHIRPWDFDYNIRKEYELEYGVFPPTDLPLRGVMGRLMSYKEIWNYSEGVTDWFWRRPQTEPIWTIDCISGGYRNEKTQPFRTVMTGLNPRDLRRAYEVVLERPWTSRLDPVHHWGVYIDQGDNYYKDDPVRILMACCAEHVGRTDGCWIALRGDPTALEGVVKPYQLFPYVFRNVWEKGIIPSEDAIKRDVVWGTAFKDYARYESLHNRIQAGLDAAAKAIRSGYGKYQKVLEAVLDSPGSDSKRDRYPYESNAVLSDTERESIASVIRLQYEFNAIQCIGEMPSMADYVNKHIFKVSDMLVHFTYDKMGAELEGVPNEKLKFFSTSSLEDPQKVKAFTDLIAKAKKEVPANFQPGGKYAHLTAVSKSALTLQTQLEYFKTQQVNYLLLKSLLSDHIALDLKVLNTTNLSTLKNSLKEYETRQTETIAKQAEFNTVVKNIRNNLSAAVPAEILIQPQPFKEKGIESLRILIEGRKLKRYITSQTTIRTPGALPLKPAKLQTIYNTIKQAETNATAVLKRTPSIVIPERLKPQTKNYFIQYQTTIDDIDKDLKDIINTNFPRLITYLTVLSELRIDDPVKEQALKDLGVEPNVTDAQNVIQVAETKKINAEKQLEKDVALIIQQYQVEQTQKSNTAKTKLEEMKQSAPLPDTQVDPKAEIEKRIKPLLDALPLLIDVDDLNQLGLKYEKRVGEILNLLPTEKEISDTETAKPKDNVRVNFVTAWNSPQSLYGAAKNLADALAALLALGGNTAANAQNVNTLLDKAEEKAKEARGFIESETVRLARLKREQEEKEEAERLVREAAERLAREAERKRLEQEKLAREAEEARQRLERERLEQERKKKEDQARLESIINRAKTQIFVQAQDYSKIRFSEVQPLVQEANLIFLALKDNTSYVEVAKLLGIDGLRRAITTQQYDKNTLEVTMTSDMLYIHNLYEDSKRWEAFIEAYILFCRQDTSYIQDIKRLATIAKIPIDQTPPLPFNTYDLQLPVPTPIQIPKTGDLITTTHFQWTGEDGGTCPYDSIFSALFKIPGLWLERAIYSSRKVSVKNDKCLNDIVDNLPLPEWMHQRICKQIRFLQDPSATEKGETCITKKTWKECISVDVIGAENQLLDDGRLLIGDLIKYFYNQQRFFAGEILARGQTIIQDNPMYETKELLAFTLGKTQNQMIDESGQITYTVPLYLNNGKFTLISCVSFQPGHWVSYVRDPRTTEWWYFNAVPFGTNIAQKIGVRGENVPFMVTTGNAGEQPCGWYYMRVPDELKRVPAPTPAPAPAPQGPPLTRPTLQFSNDPNEALPAGTTKEARIKQLFEANKIDIGIPQQDEIALLDKPWDSVKAYILSLDDVRLEGLLHAWWALRSDNTSLSSPGERTQRFVVGISRADLDTNVLEGPTPQTPPPQGPTPAAPSPVVITPQSPPPQGPPPIVITPQGPPLNVLLNTGLELYANPKDVVSFEDAFNRAQAQIGNNLGLGLGPRFDDIKEIGTDPYRLTGLLHAWWGATQNPVNMEAQVRGMSMADL